ncbi:glycoside hydrolase family 127 protein [Streptomyces sp. NA02950]|uniref:glycoside hydrolase family 127 protein n=1 Tax=Streptomyces sp. NA02950 TaxID=2742137 RepID=UPI001592A710|nr:beta-L-arabinofuranosidase domain-containing protein [Streptomyces sp. NA02950]QKV96889.1 glycoside hydrolase family 127 protein [Streptomyces sp. NA02950]
MSAGPIRLSPEARTALCPATAARITGGFWATRRRINAEVSVPQGWDRLAEATVVSRPRAAACEGPGDGRAADGPLRGAEDHLWLEAACWQLAEDGGGTALEELAGRVERLVAAARTEEDRRGPSGRIRTEDRRWPTPVPECGPLLPETELYGAVPLLRAAVAHRRATGESTLLDVAQRYADRIGAVFDAGGDMEPVCGPPGIGTALVELYRETGERRHLELAEYLLDRREKDGLDARWLEDRPGAAGASSRRDRVPVREASEVTGHAVDRLRLLTGVADLAAETGDLGLREALVRLWEDMAATKTHVTGGVAARHGGESFGEAYELPPDRAHAETCAAVASIGFSWRMALLTGDARYSDLIERTLFNAFAAGGSLDGERWSAENPLQARGHSGGGPDGAPDGREPRRAPWARGACCPPRAVRLLASLPYYMASGDAEGLQLHQYASGSYTAGGGAVRVGTAYPWEGRIAVVVDKAPEDADWTLSLRIPHWAREYEVTVGGEPLAVRARDGWLRLRRRWRPGEVVVLSLPLSPRRTRAAARIDAVRGCAAIERGPLVYCLEEADQPDGVRLDDLALHPGAPLSAEHRPGLLGGVTVIATRGVRRAVPPRTWWPYTADCGDGKGAPEVPTDPVPVHLTAIPYYAWANRGDGPMRVWIPG